MEVQVSSYYDDARTMDRRPNARCNPKVEVGEVEGRTC